MAAATTVLFRSAKIFQKEIFFESGCTNRSDFGQGVQRHPGAPSGRNCARPLPRVSRRPFPTEVFALLLPPVSRSTVPTPYAQLSSGTYGAVTLGAHRADRLNLRGIGLLEARRLCVL
jgi:hypothetical protein